jgi:hypothetical protein
MLRSDHHEAFRALSVGAENGGGALELETSWAAQAGSQVLASEKTLVERHWLG